MTFSSFGAQWTSNAENFFFSQRKIEKKKKVLTYNSCSYLHSENLIAFFYIYYLIIITTYIIFLKWKCYLCHTSPFICSCVRSGSAQVERGQEGRHQSSSMVTADRTLLVPSECLINVSHSNFLRMLTMPTISLQSLLDSPYCYIYLTKTHHWMGTCG